MIYEEMDEDFFTSKDDEYEAKMNAEIEKGEEDYENEIYDRLMEDEK